MSADGAAGPSGNAEKWPLKRRDRLQEIALMSTEQRIKLARAKADTLTDRCLEVEGIHANNQFLTYSNLFGDRLQKTYAGNALAYLQAASFGFELVRLTALWDPPAADKVSIPEIVALIDEPAVVTLLWGDFQKAHGPAPSAETAAWNARRFTRALRHAFGLTRAIEQSPRHKSLRAHRDKFFAHNLTITTRPNPRYGYERKLLRASQRIGLALSSVLENRGLDYVGARSLNQRHAAEFWTGLSWSAPLTK
jgi:hypothetical protein